MCPVRLDSCCEEGESKMNNRQVSALYCSQVVVCRKVIASCSLAFVVRTALKACSKRSRGRAVRPKHRGRLC